MEKIKEKNQKHCEWYVMKPIFIGDKKNMNKKIRLKISHDLNVFLS